MIPVKICGITTPDDAALAAAMGAAAIGIVFWPDSPRFVERSRARDLVAAVPAPVAVVGVFVNQPEALDIAWEMGLSAVQLHGDEAAGSYAASRLPVIKAIGVSVQAPRAVDDVPATATVLLDAHDAVKRGGTGRTADWSLAAGISRRRPVILSGGLNAANVLDAVAAVGPIAVDVSSGVESAPGKKDPRKLRELFDALRDPTLAGTRQAPFDAPMPPFGNRHISIVNRPSRLPGRHRS